MVTPSPLRCYTSLRTNFNVKISRLELPWCYQKERKYIFSKKKPKLSKHSLAGIPSLVSLSHPAIIGTWLKLPFYSNTVPCTHYQMEPFPKGASTLLIGWTTLYSMRARTEFNLNVAVCRAGCRSIGTRIFSFNFVKITEFNCEDDVLKFDKSNTKALT